MTEAMERRHLVLADRHIAIGEKNITQQTAIIERLDAAGHDTTEAKRTLVSFEGILQMMYEHRTQILRKLAIIENDN